MSETFSLIAEAIDDVLSEAKGTEEFKRRFRQLILNAIEDNYTDGDLLSVINLAPEDS